MLTKEEMSQWVDDVSESLGILRQRDLVARTASGDLIGVYPFTVEERVHSVRVNGFRVHAMCALDALAIAPMFQETTQISSRCQLTGEAISIQMAGESILNLVDVRNVTFGIAWGAADPNSCCADSLCMEMVFLRDKGTAQTWLSDDPESRELFTLLEAVQFSSRFFSPLLS
jgi:mercuric reductase